jgi:Tol biopolymer transport system component
MGLPAGARLGPYEIVSAIGAGGMGEVYRAHDTRLGRDVAIKVLPEAFAQDADRLARFEREARAIAALNHPNILAVHDTGTDAGPGPVRITYIVTELLEGDTLRDRLHAGRLPVRKAIEIGIQIARGLAAAHDKGVVHRDLKPDNVFLLADGQVKILDFGLAKPLMTNSGATETAAAVTDPGAVMGTVGYMAPEQVRGQATDARTDLFAFGAVLYEMISGRRAFQRETAADTMTAILNEDPPEITGTRTEMSPALERLVRHCLEKNPAERFQSARDIAFALEGLSGSQASAAPGAVAPRRSRGRTVVAGALLVVVAVAAYVWWTRSHTQSPWPMLAFEPKTWDAQFITNARFAPDGSIVFSAARTGGARPQVYAIRPGSVASQPIGPANTQLLSVSSKGELAVISDCVYSVHRVFEGTLAIMTPEGVVQPKMEHVREADWAPDGVTLAVIRPVNGIDQLEYPIGTILYQNTGGYLSDPRVSPDGAYVAFADHGTFGDDNGKVRIVDRKGKTTQVSEEFFGIEGMAWIDGRWVLFSASSLVGGQQILPWVMNVDGPLRPRIAVPAAEWTFVQDVSADGRLLLTREDLRVSNWAKRKTDTTEREYGWLTWSNMGQLSHDGRKLVFSDQDQTAGADYAVRMFNTDVSAPPSKLGNGLAWGLSPDGKWALAFVPFSQQLVLYPTGPGESVKLDRGTVESYRSRTTNWLSDGRQFLFCGSEKARPARCYRQPVDGGPPTAITEEGVVSVWLAPDDRTLLEARTSGEFVLGSLDDRATRPAKGLTPDDTPIAWSRDGRAAFVQAGAGVPRPIIRVDVFSGTRTPVQRLAPPDQAGVIYLKVEQWLDDGAAYVYSCARDLSRLFVVSGFQVPPIK